MSRFSHTSTKLGLRCLLYGKNKCNSIRNWFVLTSAVLLANGDAPNLILPKFARSVYFFSHQLLGTYRNE